MYPTLTVVTCPIIILVVEYETECFNYVVEGRNTVKEGSRAVDWFGAFTGKFSPPKKGCMQHVNLCI